jgi:hypothetical protein
MQRSLLNDMMHTGDFVVPFQLKPDRTEAQLRAWLVQDRAIQRAANDRLEVALAALRRQEASARAATSSATTPVRAAAAGRRASSVSSSSAVLERFDSWDAAT